MYSLRRLSYVAAASLFVLPYVIGASIAATVEQSNSSFTQPLIDRDESGFSSCGFRSVVNMIRGDKMFSYDFSMSVYKSGMALGKAGRYTFTEQQILARAKPVADTPEPVGYWVARSSGGTYAKISRTTKSPDSGFVIGQAEFLEALDKIAAVVKNDNLQAAVIFNGDRVEHAYEYTPNMKESEANSLATCIREVVDKLPTK